LCNKQIKKISKIYSKKEMNLFNDRRHSMNI